MSEALEKVTASNDGRERSTFYARYSSDHQRRASIEDQIRNCRDASIEKGWFVVDDCIRWDEERTGAALAGRNGMRELIAMAKQKPRPFDIIVIDDTSRFGRNVGDVFKMLDILDHHGVRLYFASDDLMSGTDWFRDAFMAKARADEQFLKTHGKRVRRGRIGRFLAGFNPGGGCYGYRNQKVFDPTRKGEHGEPALIGMRQVIDPEQAKIVLRIFIRYADGISQLQIAIMLNDEGVPPPQSTRTKLKASWSKSAIEEILKNDRYRGKLIYGRTIERRDPETGKKERSDRPRSEWLEREDPDLRIISDELFARVQERRMIRAEKFGVKQSGGMNRTASSRKYLLSGLLKCGFCGGSMRIRTSNPPRYACSNHTSRNTCTNTAMIGQAALEAGFLAALAEKVRSPELREELIQMVLEYVQNAKTRRTAAGKSAEEQRSELESNRRRLIVYQQNLVTAVRESGGSRALYEDLARIEARIARIDEMFQSMAEQPACEASPEEIRSFLEERLHTLENLFTEDPERLRNEFQKRITEIVVTPVQDADAVVFHASGDVELFAPKEGVVQPNPVDLIGLHYTIPVRIEIPGCKQQRRKNLWQMPTIHSASHTPIRVSCSDGTKPRVGESQSVNEGGSLRTSREDPDASCKVPAA